jgi:DNA-binding CsgD family transcriptional regulator
MICPCTSQRKPNPLCHTMCAKLKADLKNRETSKRDIIMPIRTIYELLNIQGDPWELQSVERQAMISQAYDRLPKRQQQCLRLFFRDLMTCVDIGRSLDISRTTVRIHARRGMESIFRALGEPVPMELDSYFPPETKRVCGYVIEGSEQRNQNREYQINNSVCSQQAVTKGEVHDEDKFNRCA